MNCLIIVLSYLIQIPEFQYWWEKFVKFDMKFTEYGIIYPSVPKHSPENKYVYVVLSNCDCFLVILISFCSCFFFVMVNLVPYVFHHINLLFFNYCSADLGVYAMMFLEHWSSPRSSLFSLFNSKDIASIRIKLCNDMMFNPRNSGNKN